MPGIDFGGATIWIDGLLIAVKQFLVTQKVYSQDAVWTYLGRPEDLMDHPPRENFLVVSAVTATPEPGFIAGGGNFTPRLNGSVTLTQFARLFTDRSVQDSARIEQASSGLAQQARQVFKCMQLWTNGSTTSPLVQPARLVGPVRFNARKVPLGWASVDTTWDLPFQADMS